MIGRAPRSIQEVAERQLCSGCGVCSYVQPDDIRMVDTVTQGRRPLAIAEVNGKPVDTGDALRACPGASLGHSEPPPPNRLTELDRDWGPVLQMWEGWATDPEIRYAGSSGGAATALATFCLQGRSMHGVLHTAARQDVPFLNRTVLSRTRSELLEHAGSRYAPASPCDGLSLVEEAPTECVFIGKPCDVAGAANAARQRPALALKLGLTIAVFCAGTPTTDGTLAAIRAVGMDPEDVTAVRYRGQGWPGRFSVLARSGEQRSLSYEQSWSGVLQKHRQWRCRICPDHTGEFADISVGDPWYREIQPGEHGRSLVIARTERGRAIIRDAIAAGSLTLTSVPPDILPRSQPNLLAARGHVWGRIATMRAMGLPAPRFHQLPMFRAWWKHVSLRGKMRSLGGTAYRILHRGLHRRQPVTAMDAWNGDGSKAERATVETESNA